MFKSTNARGPAQRHLPSVDYALPIDPYRRYHDIKEPEGIDLSLVIVPQRHHALSILPLLVLWPRQIDICSIREAESHLCLRIEEVVNDSVGDMIAVAGYSLL